MKFFLDTADLAEIEEAASWGALAGVTTNPTLYSRIGGKLDDFHNHIKRICDIVGPDCPVSAESVAMTNYDFTAGTVSGEKIGIIAASIRSANHVTQAALMGADIATVPFGILKKCVQHPLTDRGLESFLKDWEKVQNA